MFASYPALYSVVLGARSGDAPNVSSLRFGNVDALSMCRNTSAKMSGQGYTVRSSNTHQQPCTRARKRRLQRRQTINNMLQRARLGSINPEMWCTRLPVRILLSTLRWLVNLLARVQEEHLVIVEAPVIIGPTAGSSAPTFRTPDHSTTSEDDHGGVSVPIVCNNAELDCFMSFVDLSY